jgi:hypothetical protein
MSDDGPVRDGAYDDLLDAIADGEGYYLEGPEGHGWLPPRLVDPVTGSTDLTERPLPETGDVETYTVIHAPLPSFSEEAPYVIALVDFGPVTLTGQVRGVPPADVSMGMTVEPTIETSETTGDRLIGFRPTTEER